MIADVCRIAQKLPPGNFILWLVFGHCCFKETQLVVMSIKERNILKKLVNLAKQWIFCDNTTIVPRSRRDAQKHFLKWLKRNNHGTYFKFAKHCIQNNLFNY